MQSETFNTKRTPEGAIDIRHYASEALAERQSARTVAIKTIARLSRRAALSAAGFILFWNIPAMGSASTKELPYR